VEGVSSVGLAHSAEATVLALGVRSAVRPVAFLLQRGSSPLSTCICLCAVRCRLQAVVRREMARLRAPPLPLMVCAENPGQGWLDRVS
jgi:hypothetical protein